MTDEWRAYLYMLGVVPQLLFGGRFLVQWLCSERLGQSTVPRLFWQMSLVGHTLMAIHGGIQLQYPVSLVQACSGVIAWRNLDLQGARRLSLPLTFLLLAAAFCSVTVAFMWIAPMGPTGWFQAPRVPWRSTSTSLAWGWHLWGTMALLLFSSRFWVQWWQAEREQVSRLGPLFWWLTWIGNSMLFIYFWQLGDPINWVGPLLMTVPTVRNLLLLRRTRLEASHG